MKTKYWNWIYFIGFILPVIAYFGSYVGIALSDGSGTLINGTLFTSIVNACTQDAVSSFTPVSLLAKTIIGYPTMQFFGQRMPMLYCWTLGCDFVLWLGVMHLVLDVFMLLTNCLSRLFRKFGGAD